MIRIYIIGLCVLIIAIVVNILVSLLGISTWYDFGTKLYSNGFNAIKEAGVINCIWLFILYPICLGLSVLLGDKIHAFF